MLVPTADGARFAHALIRGALYEGTLPLRRRAWHRRAGAALAATRQPDPDTVAYHFRQASDAHATEWLVKAAERAWHSYAWLTATERYEAALALMGDAADRCERATILLILGQLWRLTD